MSSNETTAPVAPTEKPVKPTAARLPSLTQLAARIGPTTSNGPTPSSGSRPRLAASLLARTGSSQGAPKDPSAISPADGAESTTTDNTDEPPSDQLASTTLDGAPEEDESTPTESRPKMVRGYKNVPSLEAITERMALVRAKSSETHPQASDATEKEKEKQEGASEAPPAKSPTEELEDGEVVESNEAEKAKVSKPLNHPLQHTWTLFHDCKSRLPLPSASFHQTSHNGESSPYMAPPNTATGEYEAGLTTIGDFNTVEDFCRYFNWLKPPSQLERNSNYHLFKDGIKPMWEDPANAEGGKWVVTMKSQPELLDRSWAWLAMALVGEELDERDEICGAVVSLRTKLDRIQVWLRSKEDVERINQIGKKLVKLLDIEQEPGIGLEFQFNTDDRPTHTKFISIVASQGSSFRGRGPSSAVSETGDGLPGGFNSGFGGGMGSFGTGGSGWRGGRLGGAGRGGGSAFNTHSRSGSQGSERS
ncbi:hypothetical protein FRB94_004580 [Tulasnella sp. JGI-2019a]|nr:hypothetical protein FRB93_005614 [Tulasnella sp. JGI-2019a]KAG9001701.1 hypothetical protein FRB94_004580 [Tulasnella sp. JGI-2019a]KAG9030249.1 hypothetical protein FRB95_004185 [Tulasnella sp. JGI-2019a]